MARTCIYIYIFWVYISTYTYRGIRMYNIYIYKYICIYIYIGEGGCWEGEHGIWGIGKWRKGWWERELGGAWGMEGGMVGSSGVWRVGCMWRVEECEVECACAYGWGKDWYIYNIYTYIYLFIYAFHQQGYAPPCRQKTASNTQSLSSNDRKE